MIFAVHRDGLPNRCHLLQRLLILIDRLQGSFTNQCGKLDALRDRQVQHLMISHYIQRLKYRIGGPQKRQGLRQKLSTKHRTDLQDKITGVVRSRSA